MHMCVCIGLNVRVFHCVKNEVNACKRKRNFTIKVSKRETRFLSSEFSKQNKKLTIIVRAKQVKYKKRAFVSRRCFPYLSMIRKNIAQRKIA